MYPLNDNDLDRLSREAAEQYDVDQNTSGWDALENRLNKELPLKEERERRRFLFWLFFIVLLAGGGLLWTMTSKTNNTVHLVGTNTVPSATENKNTNAPVVPSSPNPGIVQEGSVTPAPATVTEQQQAAPLAQQDNNDKNSIVADDTKATTKVSAPGAGPSGAIVDKPSTTRANKKGTINGGKKGRQQNEPTIDKELLTANDKTAKSTKDKKDDKKAPGQDIQEEQELIASMVSATGIKVGSIGAIKAPPLPVINDTAAAQKTPPKKKDNKNKGFEIGLVAGPDMSNVKFTDMDKVGYNVGLQIGYRFSDRWSVNTGLLYTKKNYTAQGKDWTKSGWWRYVDVHTVQGYCQMFDIPLNVRYDFSVNKKQRWFASAGASTYIMTDEYYNYDYTWNGARDQRDWERDSTSTYLFSILNLSAGFERSLNKRFSIQAEPYFKIPMKGLGYGKLDLNSYGIYFSVKYKLGK